MNRHDQGVDLPPAGTSSRTSAAEPYAVTVADDGSRVMYLRAVAEPTGRGRLWVLDVATGEERRVADAPIDGYAPDALCRVAVYHSDGRLARVRVDDDAVEPLPAAGPVTDARPDPTGRRIAYLTGDSLRVIDEQGRDELLAGEDDVVWGGTDRVGREVFGRRRGYWWSPDGDRLLATRTAADGRDGTSLHLLDLDGFWVDVRWDRQAYPHLVAVIWQSRGGPLVTVLPRSQHHALVLAVDPRTGETQVHAELDDPRWVTVTPGTPAYLPDGRVVLGGELSLDTVDTRCLFADGILLTPPRLYVRRLCGQLPVPPDAAGPPGTPAVRAPRSGPGVRGGTGDHAVDLIVEASEGEPSERHVYRVRLGARSGSPEVVRLTTSPGWHTGYAAGNTVVVGSESLDHAGVRMTVHGPAGSRDVPSFPADPPAPPRPVLSRVTDRRIPCGVLYPAEHVTGRRLPALVSIDGGPARQGVVAARSRWLGRQWYADRGFAIVVIDSRGTPGVSPGFEKAIYRRVADIMLGDQADALEAIGAKHPDLDLSRVVVRGTGLGGALAVTALLRHPERFRAAVAVSPITDWAAEPAGYAERYLGPADDNPDAYARHDLLAAVAELPAASPPGPLLLVRPPDPDRAASTLRLADALRTAGSRVESRTDTEATPELVVRFLRQAVG